MEDNNDNNPFIIQTTEEERAEEVAQPQIAKEVEGDTRDLIPLCAQHAVGPQLNTATFGYDIAQMERRPWSEPGAKLSDYFNYGFNEQSWRLYCAMQVGGEASLLAKAKETLHKLEHAAHGPAEEHDGAVGVDNAELPYPSAMGVYGAGQMPYAPNHSEGARRGGAGFRGGPAGRDGGSGPYPHGGGGANSNYKTKLCQRFAEGRCTRGSQCSYAHGLSELRQAPVMAEPPAPPVGGDYYAPPQNYAMPPYPAGNNLPPMPAVDAPGVPRYPADGADQVGGPEHGADHGGFRMPPNRPRQDHGHASLYEPQY